MPLTQSFEISPGNKVALWRLDEDISFFKQRLDIGQPTSLFLEKLHPVRAAEWLAGRYLVRELAGATRGFRCEYDKYGKPFLPDDPRHISMSHSHGLVAAAINDREVGIDVQRSTEKLIRVESKFASERELEMIHSGDSQVLRLICWSAKEALFKLHRVGQLSFRKHLWVNLEEVRGAEGMVSGHIRKGSLMHSCVIHFFLRDNYALIQAQYSTDSPDLH